MDKRRHPVRAATEDDRHTWHVLDDLAPELAINPSELDAVEAFLMQLVNAILSGETVPARPQKTQTQKLRRLAADSKVPQTPAHEEGSPRPRPCPDP